jgi:hypothetical protein
MGYKQLHWAMNDDLLDLIGKAVIKSRDEATRVYWMNITPCLGLVSDSYSGHHIPGVETPDHYRVILDHIPGVEDHDHYRVMVENDKCDVHNAIKGFGESLRGRYYDDDISFDESTNTMTYPDNGTETMPYIKWVMVMESCERRCYLFVDSLWDKMDKIDNMMVFESRMVMDTLMERWNQ